MDIGKNESLKLVKETAPTLYQKKKKKRKKNCSGLASSVEKF